MEPLTSYRRKAVVVVDAGHGGSVAVGGSSANNARGYNGLLEKDLTLDVASALKDELGGQCDVRLTRNADVNLSLADRAQVARDANADLFISIHFNGSPDATVDGTEAWVSRDGHAGRSTLAQSIANRVVYFAGTRNRGVKQMNFGVLMPERHAPNTAACLVELVFLSNHAEGDRLRDTAYKRGLASSIAEGVRDYLAQMSRSTALFSYPQNAVEAGEQMLHCDALAAQVANGNNLALRWNAMSQAPSRVDIVLHLHGFTPHGSGYSLARKSESSGIDLQHRSRPTLGFVPLGRNSGPTPNGKLDAYSIPALTRDHGAGATQVISWGLVWFGGQRAASTGIAAGRRIFTAHSGGGARLMRLLDLGLDPQELHLFDCLYEAPTAILSWLRRHIDQDAHALAARQQASWADYMRADGGALRCLITGGTERESLRVAQAIAQSLRALDSSAIRELLRRFYRVERVRADRDHPDMLVDHDHIPKTFGGQLLADASAELRPSPVALIDPEALSHSRAMDTAPTVAIPPRPSGALSGSAFMATVAGDVEPRDWVARENAFVREIAQGNVPDFLRRWVPVTVTWREPDGTGHLGTFEVMPDFLAIGADADYVLTPLDAISAQRAADAFGCLLPTSKMVWDIYQGAPVKLPAIARDYWRTNPRMQRSTAAYVEHDRAIKRQLAERAPQVQAPGLLREGHKKNVVISPALFVSQRGKLAFYGFFLPNGQPVQHGPGTVAVASFAHEPAYADYSHGVRLVHPEMTVDGQHMLVAQVLAHPVLHRLLSNEGPLSTPRVPATR
ncbi:N-acetylmuramoyl-L-alanine amidase family protein [Paraburkholderia hospita]|uniref:N-acetylmuramoyl-L-alanine amidase family protein n=1 Tax=Paraburkholderia hospita TaxID=169430 RepID=UPI003ECC1D65